MLAYLGIGGLALAAAAGIGVLAADEAAAATGDAVAANQQSGSQAGPARRAALREIAPAASVAPRAAPTNQAPVISNVAVRTPNVVTGAVAGNVTASDPERTRLTFTATTASTSGRVTITSYGSLVYTPTPSARHAAARTGAGTSITRETVTVTVTDAGGAFTVSSVSVPISPKNAVPRFARSTVGSPDPILGTVTGKVSATDADKDPLSFSAPAFTGRGTIAIDAMTGAFSYTPTVDARHTAAQAGAPTDKIDTFTVTVNDGYGGQATTSVQVAISPAVRLPEPQYLPVTAQLRVGGETIGLEVASTRDQQWRGMMGRPPLAADRGMLFRYASAGPQLFWMWQTPAALDMVFLLGGQVKAVYASVPPCLAQPCQYYGPLFQPVDAVIELRSGRAAELGLTPGVRVTIEDIISPAVT